MRPILCLAGDIKGRICSKTSQCANVWGMAPPNITQVPPIQYPRVTVAGITLTVKFNFQAKYLLSDWGISVAELPGILESLRNQDDQRRAETDPNPEQAAQQKDEELRPHKPMQQIDPRVVAMIVKLFAACVGHNYTALGQDPPPPMFWAEKIDDVVWPLVCRAVFESLGKASPAGQQPAPTLAEATPAVQ